MSLTRCVTAPLAGLVPHAADWKAELGWLRAAGDDGVILFENVAGHRGELQDRLRRERLSRHRGSAYGDRLENDRGYAQQVLNDIGLSICPVHSFPIGATRPGSFSNIPAAMYSRSTADTTLSSASSRTGATSWRFSPAFPTPTRKASF